MSRRRRQRRGPSGTVSYKVTERPATIHKRKVGKSKKGHNALYGRTGPKWTRRLPGSALPKPQAPGAGGPTGARDVWLARDIQVGSQGARTRTLRHWDGRRWHLVGLRLLTSFVDGMAQDGHGGLWLVTNGAAPRYDWFFDHMPRTGILFRQSGPSAPGTSFGQIAPISSPLTWVLGTRSA